MCVHFNKKSNLIKGGITGNFDVFSMNEHLIFLYMFTYMCVLVHAKKQGPTPENMLHNATSDKKTLHMRALSAMKKNYVLFICIL